MSYETPDTLACLLALTGALIAISGTAVSTPWVIHPGSRSFNFLTTQPARYFSAFVAFVVPIVMWAVIFRQFSVQQVLTGLAEFRSVMPSYGWPLTIVVGIQALMPVLGGATFVRVLCTPPHFVRLPDGTTLQTD